MQVKLDINRTWLQCPFCKLTGGLVFRMKVYELHFHLPFGQPEEGKTHNLCTLFLEDTLQDCRYCYNIISNP